LTALAHGDHFASWGFSLALSGMMMPHAWFRPFQTADEDAVVERNETLLLRLLLPLLRFSFTRGQG